MYVDLDAPDPMDTIVPGWSESLMSSTLSSSSGKKLTAADKDPGWPRKGYMDFVKKVTLQFYRIRKAETLRRQFLEGGEIGVMKLHGVLETKFWRELSGLEHFMDFNTFYRVQDWMIQNVHTGTTNLMNIFYSLCKPPRAGQLSDEDKELRTKLLEVQKVCSRFLSSKIKGMRGTNKC